MHGSQESHEKQARHIQCHKKYIPQGAQRVRHRIAGDQCCVKPLGCHLQLREDPQSASHCKQVEQKLVEPVNILNSPHQRKVVVSLTKHFNPKSSIKICSNTQHGGKYQGEILDHLAHVLVEEVVPTGIVYTDGYHIVKRDLSIRKHFLHLQIAVVKQEDQAKILAIPSPHNAGVHCEGQENQELTSGLCKGYTASIFPSAQSVLIARSTEAEFCIRHKSCYYCLATAVR